MWRYRELIGILFMRDLKAQYRQSFLGYLWIIFPPRASTAAWYYINSQGLAKFEKTPIPYPAFVLVGQILWGTFTASFGAPQGGFAGGQAVFMKLKVPPEAFIANSLAKVVFDIIIRLLLLIPVFFLFWDKLTLGWSALLFPLGVLILMLLGASLGLLLVPIGSLYSDIGRAAGVAMPFFMFIAPVNYMIPTNDGLAKTLMSWNPLSAAIDAPRAWLTMGSWDMPIYLVVLVPITISLVVLGLINLRIAMPHLVVRMGM